jgi:anthranilate phosphoribosyltransferase
VLEALGVKLDLSPERVADCIEEISIGFLYAPAHHSAARFAAAPRKELGTRTLFNLLGPLTNPAGAPHQLLGVFAERWVEPLARVLQRLGSKHVLVVHSTDGLDELSISAPSHVAELRNGQVHTYVFHPEDAGIQRQPLDSVRVDGPEESASMIREIFAGHRGPSADMVALNAGAALYAADKASSIREGVELARSVLASGAVAEVLSRLVERTQ